MHARAEVLSIDLFKSFLGTDLKDFEVTPEEWETANHFLKNAPDGTKLSYSVTPEGAPREKKSKLFAAIENHNSANKEKIAQTKHSFIKLHGQIYAIAQGKTKDAVIGQGGYGKVKLIKNKNSQISLIKIGKSEPTIEGQVLQDLKISQGQQAIQYLETSEDSAKVTGTAKSALPMPFLGKTLFEVLHAVDEANIELDASTRLALATKLALAVYDLHGVGYGHGDLNPKNITIDAEGDLHLIDFGSATVDPKKTLNDPEKERSVTPNYSPAFHPKELYTAEQKDIYMLKKTLMMVLDWEMPEETAKLFFPSILTEEICKKFQLNTSLSILNAGSCNEIKLSSAMMVVLLLQAKLRADGFELDVSAEAMLRDDTLAVWIIELLKIHAQSTSKEVCEIINKETEVLGSKAKDALQYVFDNFLSKKYKNVKLLQPNQPILQYDTKKQTYSVFDDHKAYVETPNPDLKVVYRCNHGLSHTSRTMALVPDVFRFLLKHAAQDIKVHLEKLNKAENKARFLEKLQIAMAFYVAGREGEQGFPNPVYGKYRENSAKYFIEYAKKHRDVFPDDDEIALYSRCLHNTYMEDNEISKDIKVRLPVEEIAIKAILYGAHCADLTRINPSKKLKESNLNDMLKAVDPQNRPQAIEAASEVFGIASKYSYQMGAPFIGYFCDKDKVFKDRGIEKYVGLYLNQIFFDYETSVDKCVNFINDKTNCNISSDELPFEKRFPIDQAKIKVKVVAKPTDSAKPTVDAKPAVNAKPTVDAKPAVGAKPTVDAKPAVGAKPTVDAKPADNAKPTDDTKFIDGCFLLNFFNHLSCSQKIALSLFTFILVASIVGITLSTAGAGLIGAACAGIVLKASIVGACVGGVGLTATGAYSFFSQDKEPSEEPSLSPNSVAP